MAHFIKLNVLDIKHDKSSEYNPELINLDLVVSVESTAHHSMLVLDNARTIKVKESLDDILQLSKGCNGNKSLKG